MAADNIVYYLQLAINDRTGLLEEYQEDLEYLNEQIDGLRGQEEGLRLEIGRNIAIQRQKRLKNTINDIGYAIHDKIKKQDKAREAMKRIQLKIEGWEEARRKIVEGLPIDNKSQAVIDEIRLEIEKEEARQRRAANRGQGGRRTHRHRRKRSTRRC
jgi:hypothetical protein